MKHTTQKDIVLKLLRQNGFIGRNQCLAMRPAITRLGAIMCNLKKEGLEFDTYQYQHPNDYEYILKKDTKEKKEYFVDGKLVATKYI